MDAAKDNKKFLVVGSGGIGGYFGGRLANFGYDVTFLARGDHFEAIKNRGLEVKSVVGNFAIKPAQVVQDLKEAKSPDVVLFCVKTYDTASLAPQLNNVVRDDTVILSIQNGVGNDAAIQEHLHNGHVFPGLAHIISTKTGPGQINQSGGPRTILFGDRSNPNNPELLEIQDLMRKAEIDATASTQIEQDSWQKFVFIVAFSGMTALCRSPIGGILENDAAYATYKRSVREAIEVATKSGVSLSPNIYDDVMKRTEAYRGAQGAAKSSLLKDIEAGRRSEIETLSGTIVRMARTNNVDVPVHETIYSALSVPQPTQTTT